MRAINDMNAPKWVSQDVPIYDALLGDIFPGLELPVPDYGALEEYKNCYFYPKLNRYKQSSPSGVETLVCKMSRRPKFVCIDSDGAEMATLRIHP